MRTHGDQLAVASTGDGGREPGADKDFPPCCDGVGRLSDLTLLDGLSEADLAELVAAQTCLHRCPGWPDRRREPG